MMKDGGFHSEGQGYIYTASRIRRRPEIVEVPLIKDPQEEVEFGNGKKATLFCTRYTVDVIHSDAVPCRNNLGANACMDCPYAYVQLLAFNKYLKEATYTLEKMGVSEPKQEPKKPSRFEDIM